MHNHLRVSLSAVFIASLLLLAATGQAQADDTRRQAPLTLKLDHDVAPVHQLAYSGDASQVAAKRRSTRSSEWRGMVPRLVLCSSVLMIGALAGTEGASLARPTLIALGAGGASFLGFGAWAAAHGADTGGPLLAFMGGLIALPIAFLAAGSVELALASR